MVSFLVAPDEAIKADEAKEVRSTLAALASSRANS